MWDVNKLFATWQMWQNMENMTILQILMKHENVTVCQTWQNLSNLTKLWQNITKSYTHETIRQCDKTGHNVKNVTMHNKCDEMLIMAKHG